MSKMSAVEISEKPLPRDQVLTWLRKSSAERRAEEREIVAALSSRSGAPRKEIGAFVKSFMKK